MLWGKLIDTQDEVKSSRKVSGFVAKVSVNTTSQESRERLGLFTGKQGRQYGPLLIFRREQTYSGKIVFCCSYTALGVFQILRFLPV